MEGVGKSLQCPSPWFQLPFNWQRAQVRLLCFPPAGAGAGFYRSWPGALPASMAVLSVQYPGREQRLGEPCAQAMDELADAVARACVPVVSGRPLVLFGHSMGAAVAFEVAFRLEQAGIALERLIVSGRPAPPCQRSKALHLREDDALIAELEALGGTHRAILESEALRTVYLPIMRADLQLIENYQWRKERRVCAPIWSCVSEQDTEVTIEEARAWGEVTSGHFELEVFPGSHFFLVEHRSHFLHRLEHRLALPRGNTIWPSTP